MRQLKIGEVIALASGLFNVPAANVVHPEPGNDRHAVVRDAAVLVAWIHCGRSMEGLAAIFDVFTVEVRSALEWGARRVSEDDAPNAYAWRAEALHKAVINLKAAWRREACMNAWRARQDRTPVERSPWRPRLRTVTPNPFATSPRSPWLAWDAQDAKTALAAE